MPHQGSVTPLSLLTTRPARRPPLPPPAANWVAVAADGMTAHLERRTKLGSVSDWVVRNAWAAVLVSQQPRRYMQRAADALA